ncbi:MAG: hypothetical protein M0Q38_05685 [Bacteroidales bacterium]|jgi:hypothetical protein|nr:hypothetical protein [Bacteroidales bacterium]
MEKLISCYGLNCASCDARIAAISLSRYCSLPGCGGKPEAGELIFSGHQTGRRKTAQPALKNGPGRAAY